MFSRGKSFRSFQRQRGVAAVFAAVALFGFLAAAFFSLQLGQLYTAKRDLQKQANLAALNVARASGGCFAPDDPRGRLNVATRTALSTLADLDGEASWLSGGRVNMGLVQVAGDGLRHFQSLADAQAGQATAFEVVLERPMPSLLWQMPGVNTSNRVMRARATSVMAPAVSYRVGSNLLSVGAGDVAILNALLEALLGQDPQLDVLGVNGLLATTVPMKDLAEEMGMATADGVLYNTLSLLDFLTGAVAVLIGQGKHVAAAAVNQIAAVAPDEDVRLIEALPTGAEFVVGVGETVVNTLDLVQSLVMQLGATNIHLAPRINLPGIANVSADINLAQPMSLGVGPALQDQFGRYLTRAHNARGTVNLNLNLLPLLGSLVAANLEINLIEANAEVLDIDCAGRHSEQDEVVIGVDTSIASIRLNNDGITSPPLVNVLGLIQVCAWTEPVSPNASTAYSVLRFRGPFDPDDPALLAANTQQANPGVGAHVGDLLNELINSLNIQFCPGSPTGPLLNAVLLPVLNLLGLGGANGLLDLVEGLLSAVLRNLVDPLLNPLLRILGIDLLGGQVTVLDVHSPRPALIETS